MKKLLTIAGSDSCGCAGIQADIKTFSANGCYAMSVIAAVTAQNTQGVFAVQDIDPDIIKAEIDAIFTDIEVDGVKIGMVSNAESIRVIAERLRKYKPGKIVLDPVMVSKSGYDLLKPEAVRTLIEELVPLAYVITPNIPEAEIIADMKIVDREDVEEAAKRIKAMGAKHVLIKGGHLEGEPSDVLYDGDQFITFPGKRIDTKNTHGTGCTLSSAIVANLAKGFSIEDAVRAAKAYVTIGIEHGIELGKGVGPTHHFYELYQKMGWEE